MTGWKDNDGTTCEQYEQHGYCAGGRPKATMDWSRACTQPTGGFGPCQSKQGVRMTDGCCACGKGTQFAETARKVVYAPQPRRRRSLLVRTGKRIAPDGAAYTKEEFITLFDSLDEWDAAQPEYAPRASNRSD